jgi:hexokinase
MPTAIATNVKNSKFPHKLAVGSETRRFRKNWREQLAAYFGKIDLDIDIKAMRSR